MRMAAPGVVRAASAAACATRWEMEALSGRPGSLKRGEQIQTPSKSIWLLHTFVHDSGGLSALHDRHGASIRDRPLRSTDIQNWADQVVVREGEMEAKAGVDELSRWSCRGFCSQPAEVRNGTPTRQRHTRATTPASAPPTVGSSTGASTTSCTSSRHWSRRPRQVVALSPSIFGTYVDAFLHPPLPYIRPWPVNIEGAVRCGHQRRSCPYST